MSKTVAPVSSQVTNARSETGFFYRPDALPVIETLEVSRNLITGLVVMYNNSGEPMLRSGDLVIQLRPRKVDP